MLQVGYKKLIDMRKLLVAFRNFANAPKMSIMRQKFKKTVAEFFF
jgi:hypothetical protein